MDEFTLGSSRRRRRLLPEVAALRATPRAAIVIVHGAAEHSGRYERVAEMLQHEGCAVVRARPPRTRTDRRIDRTRQDRPERHGGRARRRRRARPTRLAPRSATFPSSCFGHSMGSVVVQAFMVGAAG